MAIITKYTILQGTIRREFFKVLLTVVCSFMAFFLQLNDEMSQKMLTFKLFRKNLYLGLLDHKLYVLSYT